MKLSFPRRSRKIVDIDAFALEPSIPGWRYIAWLLLVFFGLMVLLLVCGWTILIGALLVPTLALYAYYPLRTTIHAQFLIHYPGSIRNIVPRANIDRAHKLGAERYLGRWRPILANWGPYPKALPEIVHELARDYAAIGANPDDQELRLPDAWLAQMRYAEGDVLSGVILRSGDDDALSLVWYMPGDPDPFVLRVPLATAP